MRTLSVLLVSVVLAQLTASGADFGAGMNSTMQALPAGADLAGMGGLNVSVPTSAGNNPALAAEISEYGFRTGVYGAWYGIRFKDGPSVNIGVTTAGTQVGPGVLKLNYYQVISDSGKSKNLLDPVNVSGENLELAYGIKLHDKLLAGFSVTPWSESLSEVKIGSLKVGDGQSSGYGATVGLLYSPNKKLHLGAIYNHGEQNIVSRAFGSKSRENVSTDFVRVGATVQPWKGATFGAEWLGGITSNERPKRDENTSKVFFGGEQWLTKEVAVRLGCYDGSLACGAGVALGKRHNVWLDYSYIARPAKDLEPFWGGADMHTLTCCIAFGHSKQSAAKPTR